MDMDGDRDIDRLLSSWQPIARRAAIHVARRFLSHYSQDDLDDLIQEGLVEIWRAFARTGRTDTGFLFGAARRAQRVYCLRVLYGREAPYTHDLPDEDFLQSSDNTASETMSLPAWFQTEKIASLLLESRRKRGGRGEAAARREAAVLEILCRGGNDDTVAAWLGLSRSEAKTIRLSLRQRLRLILSWQK